MIYVVVNWYDIVWQTRKLRLEIPNIGDTVELPIQHKTHYNMWWKTHVIAVCWSLTSQRQFCLIYHPLHVLADHGSLFLCICLTGFLFKVESLISKSAQCLGGPVFPLAILILWKSISMTKSRNSQIIMLPIRIIYQRILILCVPWLMVVFRYHEQVIIYRDYYVPPTSQNMWSA